MNVLKEIYYKACSLLPMSLFTKGGPYGLLLPYHHTVSNERLPHIEHLYSYKNKQQFIKDLDALLKHYHPIETDKLWNSLKNNIPLKPGSFLLTFDDGFSEVYNIIAPILERKGVPAIFFINPDFVDNHHLFYRCKISLMIDELKKNVSTYLPIYNNILQANTNSSTVIEEKLKQLTQKNQEVLDVIAQKINFSYQDFLSTKKPFLTSTQTIDLHQRGFTIGAHSMNHPYYNLISEQEQISQSIESCKFVKDLLDTTVCHFSFPHSDADISLKTIEAINKKNSGILFGIQNQKKELFNNILHRFNAERPDLDISPLIKGQLVLNFLQTSLNGNMIKRN